MAEDIDKLILDLIDPNLDIPGSMRPLRHAASLALRSQQSRIKELEQSNDEEAALRVGAVERLRNAEARISELEADLHAIKYEVMGGEDVPGSASAATVEDVKAEMERLRRAERNRDMWKGQCERQAATLHGLRSSVHTAIVELAALVPNPRCVGNADWPEFLNAADRQCLTDAYDALDATRSNGAAAPTAPAAVGGDGDEDAERLAVAICRAKDIFVNAPYLEDSENWVPGAGYMTWEDLYLLLEFTRDRFNREDPELKRKLSGCPWCHKPGGGHDSGCPYALEKGTGPAATLSESEMVPTANDDLVTEIAEHIPLRLHVGHEKAIIRAALSSPPVREIVGALDRIVDSVSVGPSGEVCQCSDFDDARSILSRFQSVGGEKHDHADGASAEAVEEVTQPE